MPISQVTIEYEDYQILRKGLLAAGMQTYEVESKMKGLLRNHKENMEGRVRKLCLYHGHNMRHPAKLIPVIGELKYLEYLRVYAGMTSIPKEIGDMSSLQTLDLSHNNISELPPSIGRLKNLQNLYLNFNEPLKLLPEEIGNLTNLQRLELSSSNISELPPSIGRLQNLQNLHLQHASLKSLPEEIGNLTNLQTLALAYNNISELPPSIGRLKNLQNLYLQHASLKSLPEEIGNLTNLQTLDLNFNNISELPPSIGRLQNLKALNLRFLKKLTSLPEEFGNLTNLKELLISSSGIRLLPDSFENLSGLMYLEFGPASISNLTISLVHQCRSLGHYRYITFDGSDNKNKSDLEDTLAFNRARSRISFVTTKNQSTSMTPKLWPCVLHFASRAFDEYSGSPEFGVHPRWNSRYEKPAADAMYLLLVANMESFVNVLIDRNRNAPTSLGGDVPGARTVLPISIGVAPEPTRKRSNPRRSKRRRTRKKS